MCPLCYQVNEDMGDRYGTTQKGFNGMKTCFSALFTKITHLHTQTRTQLSLSLSWLFSLPLYLLTTAHCNRESLSTWCLNLLLTQCNTDWWTAWLTRCGSLLFDWIYWVLTPISWEKWLCSLCLGYTNWSSFHLFCLEPQKHFTISWKEYSTHTHS